MGLVRLLLTSRRTLARAFELVRDPRVPLRLKVLTAAGALFILSPLNILGDIPLLGILDDAALLALLLTWFVRAGSRYGLEISKQTLIAARSSIAL
ncbi:MAG: hypothetical protein JWM87_2531 [Candidatus Eremiobacteraeota bacterium]|nr:hypothetical protein [Candidatus Eremiobacteraeota bacterium]